MKLLVRLNFSVEPSLELEHKLLPCPTAMSSAIAAARGIGVVEVGILMFLKLFDCHRH
jgi:hypothetical protein